MLPDDQILLQSSDKLGTFFTNKNGRTLYFFTNDADDLNSCQNQYLSNWPVFANTGQLECRRFLGTDSCRRYEADNL
ncbi:hypothetical protein [Paenibacillus alkaliterrae]|uniref:hypothetical protein n=1 Tax=Paenibacillus alkaliterrae TaxID=320909 RepID=UPI0038B32824